MFCSKRADCLKLLYRGGTVTVVIYNPLEETTFTSPDIRDGLR